MSLSPQQARLLDALRRAGARGIHTLEIRTQLRIGNPGERRKDLIRLGFGVSSTTERRGRTHGARYILISEPQTGGSNPSDGVPARRSGASRAAAGLAFEDQPRVKKGRAMQGRTELVVSAIAGEVRWTRRTHCPPEDIDSLQTVDNALAELEQAA